MTSDILTEFKLFREQVYRRMDEYDAILRTLVGDNAEKIVGTFDDTAAVKVIDLYPSWQSGITVAVGDRYQYQGKLYKAIQAHTTQGDWIPDITPSLWAVIEVQHSGTIDDPIPWAVNMECYEGKYYSYNDTLYVCIRDSGIALAYTPDQLLGTYFNEV